MRKMNLYLGAAFLRIFFLTAGGFLGLFLLVTLFEQLRSYTKYEASFVDAALHLGAQLPWMIIQVLPMASLIGALVSLTLLARHGETTALRAAGVPIRRIARPFVVCGLVLCALTFWLQEAVVPRATTFADQIKNERIRKRPAHKTLRSTDVWLRAGDAMVHIDTVRLDENRMEGIRAVELEDHRVWRQFTAVEALWRDEQWVLKGVEQTTFSKDGRWKVEHRPELVYAIAPPPADLDVSEKKPEAMSMKDLAKRIRSHRAQGLDVTGLEVDLWAKTSLPFTCLLMPLLAVPFALGASPRSGFIAAAAMGIGLGFVYFLVLMLGTSLGRAGVLPPWLAAWLGNFIFCGYAMYLLWRSDRV